MQRASLVGLMAVTLVAVALAGCTSPQPTSPDNNGGGGTSGTSVGAGGNVTAGNTTAGGNVSAQGNTTYGNSTYGNVTGNATGNETGNGTGTPVPNATLYDHDATYTATAPSDASFDVNAAYRSLEVNVTNNGPLLVGVKVTLKDPGGNSTVVYDGSGDGKVTSINAPAKGSWKLTFEGNGSGTLHVTVTGQG